MLKAVLPENSELETELVGSYHWHIKDWKELETKTFSPAFKIKGSPFEWYYKDKHVMGFIY